MEARRLEKWYEDPFDSKLGRWMMDEGWYAIRVGIAHAGMKAVQGLVSPAYIIT